MPATLTGVGIAGLFSIDIELQDSNNACISKIDASTSSPRHVIRVTNVSTLPRDVKVDASLPNGRVCLEFQVLAATGEALAKPLAGLSAASDKWWAERKRVPFRPQSATTECLITQIGPTSTAELLNCDEVSDRRAGTPFQLLSINTYPSPFPLQVSIPVS